jgi:AcrR family transcriptional regulator
VSRRPPGRPPGGSGARERILDAARRGFAAQGYGAVTMRAVAADAGVDAALVHHYFGTKDQLFVAAVGFPVVPSSVAPQLLAGDPATLGERLVRLLISVWSDPDSRDRALAVLRSAMTHDQAAALLREFVSTELVGRVAPALPGPDPRLRVSAAVSQLIGMVFLRYVVRLEPLASASEDEVVRQFAPVVQNHLFG